MQDTNNRRNWVEYKKVYENSLYFQFNFYLKLKLFQEKI